jgi:hypothetical protein
MWDVRDNSIQSKIVHGSEAGDWKQQPINIFSVWKPFLFFFWKYEKYTHSYIIKLLVTHSYTSTRP